MDLIPFLSFYSPSNILRSICVAVCTFSSLFATTALYFFFFFFFFFLFIYIYFWLCWVPVSVQGLSPVAASGGRSSSRCAGLSLSRPLLLRSTSSRRAGSAVVAHGPSCSAARGILPDQGSNPCPLHWQADSQPLRHQGSPILLFLKYLFIYLFIYFWLRWVFVAACGLSLVVGYSSLWCMGFSLWWLLFVVVHGLLIVVASLAAEHGL